MMGNSRDGKHSIASLLLLAAGVNLFDTTDLYGEIGDASLSHARSCTSAYVLPKFCLLYVLRAQARHHTEFFFVFKFTLLSI